MKSIQWLALTVIKIIIAMGLVFFIGLIAFGVVVGVASSEQLPSVKEDSYLRLSFPMGINEAARPVFDYDFNLNKKGLSFYRVLESIEAAAMDNKITAVMIDLDHWLVSAEQTDEIIDALAKLKKSGKKVYAYGNYLTNANYRITLSADQVVMPPSASAMVNLTGYSRSFPYYKELGDKLGVKMQVIHVGDYKAFGENYSKDKMSEQFKSELVKIYDKISGNFNKSVADKRDIDPAMFNASLFNGEYALLNAHEASAHKLIDTTEFYTDFIKRISGKESEDVNYIDIDKYAEMVTSDFSQKDKIALLIAEGDIVMESMSDSPFNENSVIAPQNIIKHIRKIAADPAIKSVVLRINSGGGSALASEIIHNELVKLKNKKPLIVSMGSVAASGGYYLSSPATRIFAEKSTITGSIGVVGMLPNVHELTKKLGVNFERITKGKYADLYDLTKPVNADEAQLLQLSMQKTYLEFKNRVIEGRKLGDAELEAIAQGKVWTGEQALEIGLVDEIGGLKQAIAFAAESAKIDAYDIEIFPKEKTLMEALMKIELQDVAARSPWSDIPEIQELTSVYARYKMLGKGALMLCPYDITVR